MTDRFSDEDPTTRLPALVHAEARKRADQISWLDAVLPEVIKEVRSKRTNKAIVRGDPKIHISVRLTREIGMQLYRNHAYGISLQELLAESVYSQTGYDVLTDFPNRVEFEPHVFFGKHGKLKLWIHFYPDRI